MFAPMALSLLFVFRRISCSTTFVHFFIKFTKFYLDINEHFCLNIRSVWLFVPSVTVALTYFAQGRNILLFQENDL